MPTSFFSYIELVILLDNKLQYNYNCFKFPNGMRIIKANVSKIKVDFLILRIRKSEKMKNNSRKQLIDPFHNISYGDVSNED